ncbi:type IV secretory pathway TraG/TraD family ATPase VirD4 [Azospirillum sp. OGB3]|uniref:type IV secretory system conjugative DNA transfer family protein n=1 Tax=Azospirillum sp. OGB3 TaxID=2587012 RepID=UPI00160654C7|nr:type IV secretory system conjugative DNA transfer family protein [Azospirillum sp. OGB3]MBB3268387.1 type IV secretory pathway TraG/TraD family ATPase VirD4 [Azospirillum sp. OGB3]
MREWLDEEPGRRKWVWWQVGALCAGFAVGALLMVLSWPLAQLYDPWIATPDGWMRDWRHWAPGFGIRWVEAAFSFVVGVWGSLDGWWPHLVERFWNQPMEGRGAWPWLYHRWTGEVWAGPAPEWLVSWAAGVATFLVLARVCPHDPRYVSKGAAKWATLRDLRLDRLFCRTGLVLTLYAGSPVSTTMRGAAVRNWEWLSALVVAPPGTGKSVLLTTNLLADWPDDAELPGPSIVVNDPKGELFETTGAWRSQLGPVFRLAWGDNQGHRYNFLSVRAMPFGMTLARLRRDLLTALDEHYDDARTVFNRVLREVERGDGWQERLVVEPGRVGALRVGAAAAAGRLFAVRVADFEEAQGLVGKLETFVDRTCATLIPETIEAHWRNTGRAALTGFILYELHRAELEAREATFSDLLFWLEGALEVDKDGFSDLQQTRPVTDGDGVHHPGAVALPDNIGSQQNPTGGDAADGDRTAKLLEDAIAFGRSNGFSPRCLQELNGLLMKPDRERGSVISTAGSAIAVFKNAVVRSRTRTSDFGLSDLRGMLRTRSDTLGKPITVYITVSIEDAEYYGRLTGLFFDQAADFLLSTPVKEVKERRPVLFLADEFWTMPPLASLPKIPAFGRGQRVALVLVGQNTAQIVTRYGSGGESIKRSLTGSMSYFVWFTQTDRQAADEVQKSIGDTTFVEDSGSQQVGFGQGVNLFAYNRQRKLAGKPLFRADDIMSMQKLDPQKKRWGRMMVQFSGAMNRPVYGRPPVWFRDRKLAKRAAMAKQIKSVLYAPRAQTPPTPAPAPQTRGLRAVPRRLAGLLSRFR